jgi:hypothetical protein
VSISQAELKRTAKIEDKEKIAFERCDSDSYAATYSMAYEEHANVSGLDSVAWLRLQLDWRRRSNRMDETED